MGSSDDGFIEENCNPEDSLGADNNSDPCMLCRGDNVICKNSDKQEGLVTTREYFTKTQL